VKKRARNSLFADHAGDLLSSFVKRRMGLAPHAQAFMLDQAPEALLQALELGCAGVQIPLRNDQAGLASRLRTLGVAPEASLLSKKINSAQPRN
jgi:hypothetical protein